MRRTYAHYGVVFGILLGILAGGQFGLGIGIIAGVAVSAAGVFIIIVIEKALENAVNAGVDAAGRKISEMRAKRELGAMSPGQTLCPKCGKATKKTGAFCEKCGIPLT
ncbi:MAG: hypothetical protein LBK41_08610 [Clostridiales bacterium]|jgi:hypothetical protein|nr:hypothetical protein [Clostridiales bacterium]